MADEAGAKPEQEQNTDSILDYAIGYPIRNGWGTILIGGALTLFIWLIVPLFLVTGYFVKLTEAVASRKPTPPRFEDWGELLTLGVMAILVMLPLALAISIVSYIVGTVSESLGVIATLAFYYVFPAVFLQFAVTHTFSGAYDLDGLQHLLTHKTYFVGLLLAIVGAIGGWVVVTLVSLVSFITIIGWIIIIPTAFFYYSAFLYTILGRVYMKIQLEDEQTDGATAPVHSGSGV
ncbi:DUF4013 domain-containing protein [Natrialbaceae archaeon A-CW3]